jgi:hypothetical protein
VITTALMVVMQLASASAQVTVSDGEEVTVPVAPTGVTVQLPDMVRVVTPAGDYAVRPLAPPRPPPRANGAQAPVAPPETTDVRVFLVRQAKPEPREQPVTFLLADNRSVTVRLVAGTARDDSFVDIRWTRRSLASGGVGRAADQFLGPERALMLAMLRNENAFNRKLWTQKVDLPKYPDLEVRLLRTYESDGLIGSVYAFTNQANKTVVINPTVLAIGAPNRAVLTQMDHEELKACNEDDSPDPRGKGCMSVVRIVARTQRDLVTPGAVAGERPGAMPFVFATKPGEKR